LVRAECGAEIFKKFKEKILEEESQILELQQKIKELEEKLREKEEKKRYKPSENWGFCFKGD